MKVFANRTVRKVVVIGVAVVAICFLAALVFVNSMDFDPLKRSFEASDASLHLAQRDQASDLDAWLRGVSISTDRSPIVSKGDISGEYLIWVRGPSTKKLFEPSGSIPDSSCGIFNRNPDKWVQVHGGLLHKNDDNPGYDGFPTSEENFISYRRNELVSRIVVVGLYADSETSEPVTEYSSDGHSGGGSIGSTKFSLFVTVLDRKNGATLARRDFDSPGAWKGREVTETAYSSTTQKELWDPCFDSFSEAGKWIKSQGLEEATWPVWQEERLQGHQPISLTIRKLLDPVFPR